MTEDRVETAAAWRSLVAEEVARWPGPAGLAVVGPQGVHASAGHLSTVFPWASVTKVLAALTVLRVATQGRVDLDEPVGPEGSTLRHLLAHASGLARDEDRAQAPPGTRRIYSNQGIEVAARHVEERAGRPFGALLEDELLVPLGMRDSSLIGSPAYGMRGPVRDLARLAQELLEPRHLSLDEVGLVGTTAFPGLAGVLPGFGRQTPNDWGLGAEVRGDKNPHWTSSTAAADSFGHFGQSGSFLWVDRRLGIACVAAGDEPFGPWAAEAWPRFFGALLAEIRQGDPRP